MSAWSRTFAAGALALLGGCALWPFGQGAQPVEELEQLDVVDEDGAFDPSEAVDDEDEPGADLLDDVDAPSDAPAFVDEGPVEGEQAEEDGASAASPPEAAGAADDGSEPREEATGGAASSDGDAAGAYDSEAAGDPAASTEPSATDAPQDGLVEETFDPWVLTEPEVLEPAEAEAEVVNLAPEDSAAPGEEQSGDVESVGADPEPIETPPQAAGADPAGPEAPPASADAGEPETAVTTDGNVVELDPLERTPFLGLDEEPSAAESPDATAGTRGATEQDAAGMHGDPLEAGDVSAPEDAAGDLPPGEDIATASEVRELIAAREAELRRIRDTDVDDAAAKVQVARNPEPEERKALEPLGWRLADVALELLVLAGLAALLAGLYTGVRALFSRSS